ncbi:hypothetical protein [uncultured Phocaeicola sp.]|jgi:hypothetical protein|uniref:hypothetical protein n=3 Tax=uncultured Phocaeicola sp. TaxID=990718 RepID=UPI0025A2B390|nr:hypothetical protein [uncultured Phocaeicola sp.]
MAKKALKQNISICEIQKMIHQWKARGISDSACLKLLDLYLGLPPYMTAEGIYPLRNFYQISQSLKTTHTTILLENIRKCGTFGLVWDENHSKLLGFYSPLWQQVQKKGTAQNTDSVAGSATTVASPATTAANLATADNNILYNINNNISPSENSLENSLENSSENLSEIPSEISLENLSENPSKNLSEIPLENPDGTPHGDEAPKASSSAKEFFHRINANPKEKQAILVPIIDRIATDRNYTRRRALDALVILVNEFLIPHFDAQSTFAKTSHNGRIIWLQNLIKTRYGEKLIQQAAQKLGETLLKNLEERRKKLREFRPVSPFEWKDADKDIRYYDDPIDGKVEIPADAPPRPCDTAIWNILSKEWMNTGGQCSEP